MTMNLIQNFNTLDQNILGYGLLLGSLSILTFSIYYFTGTVLNQTFVKDIPNLQDADTVTQNIVNNLKAQHMTTSDGILNNNLAAMIGNSPVYTNHFAQTSDKHLAEKIQEILYGMCSEGEDLSNIDPVFFANEIRNNPEYSGWFNNIQDWANDIKTSSGKSFNSSEIDFLKRIKEELNSVANSPVIETNSPITDVSPISVVSEQMQYQGNLLDILYSNKEIAANVSDINHLSDLIELYSLSNASPTFATETLLFFIYNC